MGTCLWSSTDVQLGPLYLAQNQPALKCVLFWPRYTVCLTVTAAMQGMTIRIWKMMSCSMEATKFQAAFTAASLITRRQVHFCILIENKL